VDFFEMEYRGVVSIHPITACATQTSSLRQFSLFDGASNKKPPTFSPLQARGAALPLQITGTGSPVNRPV